MIIFITGGDGLLGSNLVRELLKRDHEIRVLVQPGRYSKTLEGLDIKLYEGDILEYDSLKKAAEGVDAIFHIAANTSIWPYRNPNVRSINVKGTSNVLKLAEELKVSRFIHVGTANSFSWGNESNPGIENTPYKGKKYGLDYMDSKWEAHQLVMKYVKKGVPAIIVNPTFMLGPFDSAPSSGSMIRAIYRREVPGFAPGGRNFINVKDAAIGLANALKKGRVGESYILGNGNMSYNQAFTLIADTLGVKRPKYSLPKFLVLAYGIWGDCIAFLFGKKPNVSFQMARISCDKHYYSSLKAVKELNLPQTPIREGIHECYQWMKSNQII